MIPGEANVITFVDERGMTRGYLGKNNLMETNPENAINLDELIGDESELFRSAERIKPPPDKFGNIRIMYGRVEPDQRRH